MTRTRALSICAVVFAHPALAGGQVDPATVTCSEYNRSSHQGMVDINAAVYQSTREDPKLKALTENQLGDMMDKVCAANRDARVIEALHWPEGRGAMNIAVDGKKPPRLSGSVTAAGAVLERLAPNADPALIEEFIALAQRS